MFMIPKVIRKCQGVAFLVGRRCYSMDYQKVQGLVDRAIVIDTKGADVNDLRASNNPGNDESWLHFTPERYANEEELVAVINQTFRENRVMDKEIEAGYR